VPSKKLSARQDVHHHKDGGVRAKAPAMSASEAITISRAELTDDVSRALITALNAELRGAYPEPGANHFQLAPDEVAGGRGAFFVVHHEGTPVGCGALRLLDAETAELKRMYVAPEVRGKGVGRRLVAALEAEARVLGVRRLVLETGTRQAAALALYQATGFRPIPLFGEYLRSPETSICLGKDLAEESS
jgi:GNAT superfamily N-acetyltransferase